MRASGETYKQVAMRCSSYSCNSDGKGYSNCSCKEPSCMNCEHFSKDEHCVLDLYDPIVKNIENE